MKAIAIGIGATAIMDLWHLLLRHGFGVASLNYCVVGRLLSRKHDCAIGWSGHYAVGVSLATAFVLVAPGDWLAHPTVAPSLLFGMASVVVPFFVLQPLLGLGIASSRAQHPGSARLKSLVTHAVFGLGLYVSAVCLV